MINHHLESLIQKLITSTNFIATYQNIEREVGRYRLQIKSHLDVAEVKHLFMQSSLIALGENESLKRVAQKINALIYEYANQDKIINYGAQIMCSRIGNFPAVSQGEIFKEDNVYQLFKNNEEKNFVYDSDLRADLLREENSSKVIINERIFHFNNYQRFLFEILKVKSISSFSAPTSFGKSFIVRCHIAREFSDGLLNRCLILVPTKALIDDFYEDLITMKQDLGLDYSVFTHVRSIETEVKNSIYVLTQERLLYLIEKNPELVRSFQLVYCDEAHNISRGYRGFRLREALNKIIALCGVRGKENSKTKYIFSSPIIKNPEYYKNYFFPDLSEEFSFHKEITYSPVEKNIYLVKKEENHFGYYLLSEVARDREFSERIVAIAEDKKYEYSNEVFDKEIAKNVNVILESKIDGSSIIYCARPVVAHTYAIYLNSILPEKNLPEVIIDDIRQYISDHYDNTFRIVDFLKKGIGLHYGPMPLGLRRAIIKLFEDGYLDYLICTSTLLEGVNLPAKNIFILQKRNHTTLGFWNLIGRAGRITYGLSGNVFCIGNKTTDYQTLLEKSEDKIENPELAATKTKTRKLRFIDSLLDNNYAYTRDAKMRVDIEYLIYELFISGAPQHILERVKVSEDLVERLIGVIQVNKKNFVIPIKTIMKNPGIDPRLQNNLYQILYLKHRKGELLGLFDVINNLRTMRGETLDQILSLTEEHLYWPIKNEREGDYSLGLSKRIVQWTRETALNVFIGNALNHVVDKNDFPSYIQKVELAFDVIKKLDNQISFETPKYLKCFFDIALEIISTNDIDTTYQDKVESFLFSVEAGINSSVGKYLFEKGVSRPLAIKVSSLIGNTVGPGVIAGNILNLPGVREVLERDLSKTAFKELSLHLV